MFLASESVEIAPLQSYCMAPIKEVTKKPAAKLNRYASIVSSHYDISAVFAKEVISHANKYSKKTFPRVEDILAVIGIESRWDPGAVSSLKYDPAVGLTQIRPITWAKLIQDPAELLDVENQVKYAAEILHYNFKLTKSPDDAIIAYNVGYGNWLNGKYDLAYFAKFATERDKFRRS
jgi:soluble lytic murein transglycosylase-like protein